MQVIQRANKLNHKKRSFFASSFFFRLLAIALRLPNSNGEQETQRTGRVLPAAIVGLVAVPAVMLSSTAPVSAAESKLDLTMSSDIISVDIGSANANGTFKKSANNTISVTTDHYTGYTLSIKSIDTSASTTSPALKNGSDTMPSITSSLTEEQFSSISATNYNNKYGYLPSKICTTANECTSNTSFLPAPTLTGDILDKTSSANPTANTYTMAIGARIDQTIPFGSYSNTFEVLLVANAIPYTIVYNDGVVSDMPVDVDTTSMTSSVTISSNTPVRDGYTFNDWCTVQVADNESCTGTTYAAGSTYTLDQTGTNNLQLFAMWSGSGGGGYGEDHCTGSYPCMQNMPVSTCTTTATEVQDRRDGNVYKIQRLADGKCWMLDNLRLDPTQVDLATLQGNTNASNQTLDYFKSDEGGRSAGNNYATAGIGNLTEGNSYSVPRINAKYKETVHSDSSLNYGNGSHKYGVYYNFCAATAGSYCYGNGTSAGTSVGDAGEDICPAGWRMPTGGAITVTTDGKGEYQALYAAYSSNATGFRNALSTPLSGRFYNGSAADQGSFGFFWSSTRRGDGPMYYLRVDSSVVTPQIYSARYAGFSVRCLLQ
ncbi:hypothetical protein IJ101_00855 [Candidatus Saccharibacteria bacterium]|nr:hypothetical protein [Candidatus Saccharibacteria bacterium]